MAVNNQNEMAQLLQQISLHNFDVGLSYMVMVTHINSPENFYVRPIPYRYFLKTLQTPGEPVNEIEVQNLLVIIFESEKQKMFIRGKVIATEKYREEDLTYTIIAIDYGFLETLVPLKKIFKVTYENDIPPLASHCKLADCKLRPDVSTEKATDAMKYYCGMERTLMTIRNQSDILTVELANSCGDIATLLALTNFTTLNYPGGKVNRFGAPAPSKQYFVFKELKIGEKLHVRVLSGDSLESFFVADMKDFKQYQKEEDNFTYFMRKQRLLHDDDLKVGEPIAVRNDVQGCRYERALIKAIVGPDRAKVQFVDWGTITEVHQNQLKPMSEKFYYYPAVAIYCRVEKSQLCDNNLLRSMKPSCEFVLKVKEVGKGFNEPNIVYLKELK